MLFLFFNDLLLNMVISRAALGLDNHYCLDSYSDSKEMSLASSL